MISKVSVGVDDAQDISSAARVSRLGLDLLLYASSGPRNSGHCRANSVTRRIIEIAFRMMANW
jgi:hypothetical protein